MEQLPKPCQSDLLEQKLGYHLSAKIADDGGTPSDTIEIDLKYC
jgi:hypothetical protein